MANLFSGDKNGTHKHTHDRRYYFLGHERELCPCSLQIPQSLGLFGGGTPGTELVPDTVEETVETVVLAVVVVAELVLVVAVGSGTSGFGQVVLDSPVDKTPEFC